MSKSTGNTAEITIGIISDTHDLLRQEAIDELQGSDLILHAGDVGSISILDELEETAPVVAVRGNMDSYSDASRLKKTEVIEKAGFLFYLIHDLNRLDIEPAASGIHVVINGHTHMPQIAKYNNVLYINPGSAGPRRHRLPVTVATMRIKGGKIDAEIVDLPL